MKPLNAADHVFTIGEYIEILNTFFKAQAARIRGEISELHRDAKGHVYFAIKDKDDGSVLSCIIWNRNYDLCGVVLEVGMELILSGHPNIYAPNGRLSFIADTVELVGEGALKKAYEALKRKLEAEGVFAPERKRPLPEYPTQIGVVTSMKGAVIHDFLNNLGKFGFRVRATDSRVEGQQAVVPLLNALALMRREAQAGRLDVLVLIRGGGSLESLQAFNNEKLVREIVHFPVPVVAGIGHDKDVPLSALAADIMVSTPTATAHLLSKPWEEAYAKVREAAYLFSRVESRFERIRADLDAAWSSVIDHTAQGIAHAKEIFANAERLIALHDPRRQLRLGYAIVRHGGEGGEAGKLVRSMRDVAAGDVLNTELADGVVKSRVEE
ncbi:MAG: exodeoxyribonuclease VII large subunit [Minisyncoccia bacterium]|jgi:exodeoxyribonuclease VII large subunit